MMIKVFTVNNEGKISLSAEELKKLLDEAYWEGYRSKHNDIFTYRSPSWHPFATTTLNNEVTLSSDNKLEGVYT